MTKRTATLSAREAAIEVLRAAGGPLHVKDIAARVLNDYKTGLNGKTPEATIAAFLHVGANKGNTFKKVGKGTFDLIDREGTTASGEEPATEKPPAEAPPAEVASGAKSEAKPDPKKPKAQKAQGRRRVRKSAAASA